MAPRFGAEARPQQEPSQVRDPSNDHPCSGRYHSVEDDVIKKLEGRIEALRVYIEEKNSELVKNAYRISYLETTVKAKDEMLAMKDDLHNKVMAAMESLFKKP